MRNFVLAFKHQRVLDAFVNWLLAPDQVDHPLRRHAGDINHLAHLDGINTRGIAFREWLPRENPYAHFSYTGRLDNWVKDIGSTIVGRSSGPSINPGCIFDVTYHINFWGWMTNHPGRYALPACPFLTLNDEFRALTPEQNEVLRRAQDLDRWDYDALRRAFFCPGPDSTSRPATWFERTRGFYGVNPNPCLGRRVIPRPLP